MTNARPHSPRSASTGSHDHDTIAVSGPIQTTSGVRFILFAATPTDATGPLVPAPADTVRPAGSISVTTVRFCADGSLT